MTGPQVVGSQRPRVLLAGFFVGFASVCLTLGVFWPFAPLFPALVAGIAALIPVNGHVVFAKGALFATMGVAVFEVVLVILMFVGAGLR
ncbi:Uncharacterised protein [Mycolicibacterium vanbaalenii]|uniref:Uncharacterized protein n=1 Tax=Mycolicibacterium vanbaalenii TaxID=110539 RepID=A0A5S9RC60_MYCVN|nr:hypothetical protein [Mycolicibacterium vanbaalenii]CAA0138273.1 Uncharacterised protein [Mycolicibacterium vanbaalenii]